MATLLTKGLILAGGLVGTSATCGGIYYLTSSNSKTQEENTPSPSAKSTSSFAVAPKTEKTQSISDLLKNKKLLTNSDDDNSNWATSLKLFEDDHKSKTPEAPWEFTNWKVSIPEASNLESFKKQCLKLNQEKVSGEEDPIYVAIEKYCTKEETSKQAGDV